MMHTWFECKIRYEKVMENGMFTRILPKNPLQIPSAKMPTPLLYAISFNHFLKVVRQQ